MGCLIALAPTLLPAMEPQSRKEITTTTGEGRAWGAPDSVAVRYFNPETVIVSPDGSRFFFVTFHGDLACDCNVYELTVFDTKDVHRALTRGGSPGSEVPQPLRTLTRRSANHHGSGIRNPRWESDGESITFDGPNEQGVRQLYMFNVGSGALTAMTNWLYGVGYPTRAGETIISDVALPVETFRPTYPVYAVTRAGAQAALYPQGRRVTFVSYRGGSPWSLNASDPDQVNPSFSPDSRRAVLVRDPKDVPPGWTGYDGLSPTSDTGRVSGADARRFVLIDAEHGSERPVFDAPAGTATRLGLASMMSAFPEALWARDNRHVILVNTALPLTPGSNPERRGMAYVVGYDADRGQWSAIEPLEEPTAQRRIAQVGWLMGGTELLIRHEVAGKPAPGTVYALHGDRWVGRSVDSTVTVPMPVPSKPPSLKYGLKVTLRQSANDPPAVVASDGRREIVLTTPDPALSGVWRARQEPFQWHGPAGQLMTGGLLLPRKVGEHPAPLVIQAYSYDPDQFHPDGPETNAYGAQSLVARGVAVLNVPIPGLDWTKLGTLRELTEYVAEVDSAADALAERGLIDRAHVGEIGFSHAGTNVYYAITHPTKVPPVAAVLDDSFPGTFSYLLDAQALIGNDYGGQYGGSFWAHKGGWLENEPSFNVDRVETAALFAIHDQQGLPIALETIGAFGLNHRPLEYLIFPQGSHELEMPRERLASQEASVDWMSFWLQGYEDPNPAKAQQYARWRVMREQDERRKAAESKAPPPKGHWTFVPDLEPQH